MNGVGTWDDNSLFIQISLALVTKKRKLIRTALIRSLKVRPMWTGSETTTLSSFKFHLRWSLKNRNWDYVQLYQSIVESEANVNVNRGRYLRQQLSLHSSFTCVGWSLKTDTTTYSFKVIVESEAKDLWIGKWALLLHMISKPRQEQLPEETVRFLTLSWPIYMKCLLSKNIFVLSFL